MRTIFVVLSVLCCGCAVVEQAKGLMNDTGEVIETGREASETVQDLSELKQQAEAKSRFKNKPAGLVAVPASTSVSIGTGAISEEKDVARSTSSAGETLHLVLTRLSLNSERFRVPSTSMVREQWAEVRATHARAIDAASVHAAPNGIETALELHAHLDYFIQKDAGGRTIDLMNDDVTHSASTDGVTIECAVTIEASDSTGLGFVSKQGTAKTSLTSNDMRTMVDDWELMTSPGAEDHTVDRSHVENLLMLATSDAMGKALKDLDPWILARQ